ncbi:MAG: aldo/keto reductase [Sciscionella sp.]
MDALPRRVLPGLNADVSALGAGCWTIGGPATNGGVPIGWDGVDPDAAYAGLVRAHELGVSLFDTADVYGLGRSERLVGRLLATLDRSTVVVSSKVGYFAGTARHPYEPVQMRHQFATTLDNLGTDYLDIYYLHSADFGPGDRYLPGAVEFMAELKADGLIRAVGMRAPHEFAEEWAVGHGTQAEHAARFLHLFDVIRPDVLTTRYNLLSPIYSDGETDIFSFARRHGVAMIVKQALGQGLLLKPDLWALPTFSRSDHRSRDPEFADAALSVLRRRLAPIRDRFGDSAAELARVALRYALQTAPDAPALVGFRNADQIHITITSLGDPLTADEVTGIRALLHPTADRKEPVS